MNINDKVLKFSGLCCEGRVRTSDLRVMSPTSYRCSTSRYIVLALFFVAKGGFQTSVRLPADMSPIPKPRDCSTSRYIVLALFFVAKGGFQTSVRLPADMSPIPKPRDCSTSRCNVQIYAVIALLPNLYTIVM